MSWVDYLIFELQSAESLTKSLPIQ